MHLMVIPEYAEISRGALPPVLLHAALSLLNYLQLLDSSSFLGCLGKVKDSHPVSMIRTFQIDFHHSCHIEKMAANEFLKTNRGTGGALISKQLDHMDVHAHIFLSAFRTNMFHWICLHLILRLHIDAVK